MALIFGLDPVKVVKGLIPSKVKNDVDSIARTLRAYNGLKMLEANGDATAKDMRINLADKTFAFGSTFDVKSGSDLIVPVILGLQLPNEAARQELVAYRNLCEAYLLKNRVVY